MAVHMVRVLSEPPKGEAETVIDNWVTNYTEWTNDPVEHSLTEAEAGLVDSTDYVHGDWRFIDNGEQPTDILDDLSGRLQSLQGGLWHRLGYHVCTHDQADAVACSWDEKVEWGSVPTDITDFEVS